ncbi:MAG TPA: hypothetical protein VNJ03_11455 [Vicinamibacterales bacterium]|nr:hypothetical protein [Vicinamibacterales bacterium]
MSPEEAALANVIGALERLGIPFMLTGSVASRYHGHPRATPAADLVIDPSEPQLDALVEILAAARFYVDPDSARDALRRRTQFNAIDTSYACKIDLIVRRDRPFSLEEFSRRVAVDLSFAKAVPIVTPEDAILSKLERARRSGDSEKQIGDAVGVLNLNPSIDRAYIERWAVDLGVSDLWLRVSSH